MKKKIDTSMRSCFNRFTEGTLGRDMLLVHGYMKTKNSDGFDDVEREIIDQDVEEAAENLPAYQDFLKENQRNNLTFGDY